MVDKIAGCLSVCLSVRPSVTCRYSVETVKRIIKLSPSGSHTLRVFRINRYCNIPTGTSLTGCRTQDEYEKNRDFWPIYRINDTSKNHSYYGTPIGIRMRSIEWFYFQWVTLSDLERLRDIFNDTSRPTRGLSAIAELLVIPAHVHGRGDSLTRNVILCRMCRQDIWA